MKRLGAATVTKAGLDTSASALSLQSPFLLKGCFFLWAVRGRIMLAKGVSSGNLVRMEASRMAARPASTLETRTAHGSSNLLTPSRAIQQSFGSCCVSFSCTRPAPVLLPDSCTRFLSQVHWARIEYTYDWMRIFDGTYFNSGVVLDVAREESDVVARLTRMITERSSFTMKL